MLVLALDCALSACSVALVRDRTVLAFDHRPMARGQAEHLVPMIAQVTAQAGLDLDKIDLLTTTVGPGTFTGIRIGLATIRALALALGRPVAGVTTTQAVAASAVTDGTLPILAVLDSRRDELWMQAFDPAGRSTGPVVALPPQDVGQVIGGQVMVAGDGADLVLPFLPQALAASQARTPDARALARLGQEAWQTGTALTAQPLYLRDADVTHP